MEVDLRESSPAQGHGSQEKTANGEYNQEDMRPTKEKKSHEDEEGEGKDREHKKSSRKKRHKAEKKEKKDRDKKKSRKEKRRSGDAEEAGDEQEMRDTYQNHKDNDQHVQDGSRKAKHDAEDQKQAEELDDNEGRSPARKGEERPGLSVDDGSKKKRDRSSARDERERRSSREERGRSEERRRRRSEESRLSRRQEDYRSGRGADRRGSGGRDRRPRSRSLSIARSYRRRDSRPGYDRPRSRSRSPPARYRSIDRGGRARFYRRHSPTPPRQRAARRRSRSRSASRDRRRRSRRRRSASSESARSSSASSSADEGANRKKKRKEKEGEEAPDPNGAMPTLQDLIKANPGMGVVQALQKLEELKRLKLQEAQLQNAMLTPAQIQANLQAASAAAAQVQAKAQANILTGLPAAAAALTAAVPSSATKLARELYIGNLPPGVQATQLQEFLGAAIQQLKLNIQPGNPILSTWLSADSHYAFCEFRSVDECNNATTLNGITVGNVQLKIGRPKGYTGAPTMMGSGLMGLGGLSVGSLGTAGTIPGLAAGLGNLGNPLLSSVFPKQSNFLMLVNIPSILGELDVKELLKPFGELKSFNMLKDKEGQSKGIAIFEFAERAQTEVALKGLQGLDIGDKRLHIQEIPPEQANMLLKPTAASAISESDTGASEVIRLGNMLAEGMNAEEINEIQEDVADESRKFGNVVSLKAVPEANYLFVEFGDRKSAKRAKDGLGGRSFDGRMVEADYYPQEAYKAEDLQQQPVSVATQQVDAILKELTSAEQTAPEGGVGGAAAKEMEEPAPEPPSDAAASNEAINGKHKEGEVAEEELD